MSANALIVANDPLFVNRRDQIVALAAKHRMPAMYFSRELATGSGLLSYGASLVEAARQGGIYAGKLLRGEKAADLPVMQSTKFEFIVNLKTASRLGELEAMRRHPEIAISYYSRALNYHENLGDKRTVASTRVCLGDLSMKLTDDALSQFSAAREEYNELGDFPLVAMLDDRIAKVKHGTRRT
jgi:hypothetical protein